MTSESTTKEEVRDEQSSINFRLARMRMRRATVLCLNEMKRERDVLESSWWNRFKLFVRDKWKRSTFFVRGK